MAHCPIYSSAPTAAVIRDFQRVTIDKVVSLIRQVPDRRCALAVLPTDTSVDVRSGPHCTISVWIVQPFVLDGHRSSCLQVSMHHTAIVEASRIWALPMFDHTVNFKLIGGVKASCAYCSLEHVRFSAATWSVASLAVNIQALSFNGDGSAEGFVWSNVCHRYWWPVCSGSSRLNSNFRHCWPWNLDLRQRLETSFGVGELVLEWFRS